MTTKRKVIGICCLGSLCCLLLAMVAKYYCRVYFPLVGSDGGSICFCVETHKASLFDQVYSDIRNDLTRRGFRYEEVSCCSTNDPRLRLAAVHHVATARTRVLTLERGTLRGWMTYLAMDRGANFPSISVEWEISSYNSEPMSAWDYRAFSSFLHRLKENTKRRYDEPNVAYYDESRLHMPVTDRLNQAWVMSSGWFGFMGAAIALSSNRFYYWFYSDVVGDNEPAYPVSGNYRHDGKRLSLDSTERLYSHIWVIVTNGGRACLSAPSEMEDVARLLIPDSAFDPSDPFKNQRSLISVKP